MKGYSDYLTYLQDTGIIETDNQFIIEVKSRGYGFYERYQQQLKSIPVTYGNLFKKLDRTKQTTKRRNEPDITDRKTVAVDCIVIKERPINGEGSNLPYSY